MYKTIINDLGVLRSDSTRSLAAEALWNRLRSNNPECVSLNFFEGVEGEADDEGLIYEESFYEARAPIRRREVWVHAHRRRA